MRFIDNIPGLYNGEGLKIISIWIEDDYRENMEICEYYFCCGKIIYKIDNIKYYDNIDVDFVCDYKDYRFSELFDTEPEHYVYNPDISIIEKDILCERNINSEKLPLYEKFLNNALYPYRRYNITDYFLELAGYSRELGFIGYYDFFMDYIEKNLEFNKAFLRERYVNDIMNNRFENALKYLNYIFDRNLQDNFDFMNMGFLYKMKGDYIKALEYYDKFFPNGPEHDFVRNDMIFCAENIADSKDYFKMIEEKWKS